MTVNRGLAWFSRQVPSIGPDDTGQGRVGETEIPHSDQWNDSSEPRHKDKYKPYKFNRINVMKDKNSKGSSTKLIEELYQQQEHSDDRKTIHNSYYASGSYHYRYPTGYLNSHNVNKAISLRRFECSPNDYIVTVRLGGLGTIGTDTITVPWVTFSTFIPSSYSLAEALSAIRIESRKWLLCYKDGTLVPTLQAEVVFEISGDNSVKMELVETTTNTKLMFSLTFGQMEQFLNLMNVPLESRTEYAVDVYELIFRNVWNRKQLFIHASFVTNTTGGYLARHKEFYPNLSKVYEDDGQSEFSLELSYDGYHRVELLYENFTLELSFILDSNDYEP
jgi:hypothetical protein